VTLPEKTIVASPADDQTMGSYSGIAQHIAAALQDPRVRGMVARALRDSVTNPSGLNLSDCSSGTVSGMMLSAGELRGGLSASELCKQLNENVSFTLYMDRTRLAGWDSTVIPIVTAIAKPSDQLPQRFKGYRTPSVLIDLPSDGSVGGPVLVVLPYRHTQRLSHVSGEPMRSNVIINRDHQRGPVHEERIP
jgi:hypothetical protein